MKLQSTLGNQGKTNVSMLMAGLNVMKALDNMVDEETKWRSVFRMINKTGTSKRPPSGTMRHFGCMVLASYFRPVGTL